MPIPILNKENVVDKEDPINMETGLNKSISEDDKRIEEEINDIREKIIEFIKNQGYLYTEGDQEFDDETNDIFGKGDTLIEITITTGVDNEVMKQIMEN